MNESFMDGLQSKIQNLKIRGSYGTVGNEKIPWDRQYTLVQNGQNVVLGAEETIVTGASYGVTGNPNLRWETTEQINIGFEFAVLENRLSGEMDYYNKTTSDILLNLQNPGHMGNGAFQFTTYNAAEVRNSGFEFLLNWKDDLRNGIYYEVGVLGATVKNEVLKMGQLAGAGSSISAGGLGNGQLVTLTQVGGPIGAFHGYQVIGIIQNEAQLASTPTLPNAQVGDLLFADTNGDGVLDERDMTEIGSNIPDFIYGFNLNVGYRGFSLGLDFNGQLGNELYNGKDAVRPNQYNYEANVADHWRGEGTSNTEPRPTAAGNNYLQSERFVQNGSFFRLRTATLAYELPEKWINKLKLRRASVYLRGTNLFTITEFTGYTPEIVSSSVLSSGIDLGIYPVTSIYSVGVNLSF
jgi:hypothetical protein